MSTLVRFVTMRFRPEAVDTFLEVFHEVQPKIAACPGCHGVAVARNPLEPDSWYTISEWDDANALDAYRYSELFATTWKRTKPLFRAPASAQSWILTLSE